MESDSSQQEPLQGQNVLRPPQAPAPQAPAPQAPAPQAPAPVPAMLQEASQPLYTSLAKPTAPSASPSLSRITWLMALAAFILVSAAIVPMLVQRVSYSWNLGKEKAQYEVAAETLKNVRLNELSTQVSKRAGPSVVHINVLGKQRSRGNWLRGGLSEGQGSGVVVDADGYVLTNAHVVKGADGIQVSIGRGRVVPATMVGSDELTDLAVLKIQTEGLMPISWGDSDELDTGAMVWALGSPFGLDRSITFGIVSAKHRWLGPADRPHKDYLQTDAAVNPGNSGGPLVDAKGELVGITTAIVGESYQGISFAVPSNVARVVFERIRKHGKFERGFLGIEPRSLSEELGKELGLPLNENMTTYQLDGAYVFRVTENSPAAAAGIQSGDVILNWGGKVVRDASELYNLIGNTEIGTEATVSIFRDGETRELTAVLEGFDEWQRKLRQ